MNRLPRPSPNVSRNFLIYLSFPLLALVIFGFAWRPLGGGDDFWAHASIGRWILENRQIPTRTLFLWSADVPWIAHAWGTGIWFASLMQWGGERGGPWLAQIFNALMCIAPFALIWREWRRNAPFSSFLAPVFVLAIWVSAARFHPRPELFSALFLTLLMLFLVHWPRQKTLPRGQIALVLLMFAVWPNLHGAVAFGLVFLFVAAFAELLQTRGDARLLLLALLCTLIVLVCNPRGFDYYRVLIPINSKTFERIDEWKPFWKWPKLAVELWIGELILWSIGTLLWLKNPHRRWMQLGWMLLMLAAFLKARRQLWLTALTSLLVIVSNLNFSSDDAFRAWRKLSKGDVSEPIPAPLRLIARSGVVIILVCAVAQAFPKDGFLPRNLKRDAESFFNQEFPKDGFSLRATDRKLPVQMARFLRERAPQGRLFNDYEFSAYLQWALRGKRGLYIDLNNAYPDALMDEYFEMQNSAKNPEKMAEYERKRRQILARRAIEVVALRPYTNKEGLSIIGASLDKNPGWKRVYRGIDGTVWARK